MRVLFDTNVLLDAVLAREPFVEDAAFLLEAVEAGQVEGVISATTLTDIHYVVKRQTKNAEIALDTVIKLLTLMEIGSVDRRVLEQAVVLNLSDFEDAVQVACALSTRLEAIATRDKTGFAASPVLVLSPEELKHRLVVGGQDSGG